MPGFDNGVMFANNVDFTGSSVSTGTAQVTADGQLLIGSSVSPNIRVGTLSSSDGSITWTVGNGTISGQVSGGSSVGKTITGNSGGALSPSSGNWNIITANSTPKFAGSGSTLTLDFGLTNLALGSSQSSITGGASQNAAFGLNALTALTGGGANTCIGYQAGLAITSSNGNTAIGSNALKSVTSAGGNTVAIGANAFQNLTSGGGIAIGTSCGNNLTTGVNNILINGGTAYTSSESNNICINSLGVLGESNACRIGRYGSGAGFQNALYLLDTQYPVNVSANQVLYTSASGVVSTLANGTTGQVLTATTSAAPSWQTPSYGLTWTDVTGATQTLVANNGYLTDRGGGVTYTLPASGSIGDTIKIVGKAGLATITPNANQQILIGSLSGTVGVTGTAVSTNVGDCIELICTTSGSSTVWRADSVVGNWALN